MKINVKDFFRLSCPMWLGVVALSACEPQETHTRIFQHELSTPATPWSHENFDAHPDKFTFAIVGDLNGGQRDGVFETAIAQLNLLRPELVLSVGDLIDGGSEDRGKLGREWEEFDADVEVAVAPFYYLGGNHDLTNLTMRAVWEERYGARYYHFIYKDILFFVLDTEDNSRERIDEIFKARAVAIEILDGRAPGTWEETEYFNMPERQYGRVGVEQLTYVKRVLLQNEKVRWTFLLMHKPAWRRAEDTGFGEIETALGKRPYTVVNGHFHDYSHETRLGRDYISLATTSGLQNRASEMAFDHVTLVTMTEKGPVIGNLRLDGILDKTGHIPLDPGERCYQASRCGVAE